MSKYQYSKLVMEKFLRRSFYDAVLELYETAQGTRIISVSLEGNLSFVVNKDENFVIKLNEIAQRADDREDQQHRYKNIDKIKLETDIDRFEVKKEEFLSHNSETSSSTDNEVIDPSSNCKDSEKIEGNIDSGKADDGNNEIVKELNDSKEESDVCEKFRVVESESDEQAESGSIACQHDEAVESQFTTSIKVKMDSLFSGEIPFLQVSQLEDVDRKYDCKESEQLDVPEKKPPKKKRRVALVENDEIVVAKLEDREKSAMSASIGDDASSGGLQLLPHTATGPIIIDYDDSSYNTGIIESHNNYSTNESQVTQLAMFQMRESGVSMFRQKDLEELARQQQQWQMVAYQRSIMEKSYLQQQMQQYQRDTERLRWEYAAQHRELAQPRDYTQLISEEAEKLYRQAQVSQNITPEAVIMTATAHEQTKTSDELIANSADKLSSHYQRLLAEEHVRNHMDSEYEEGELRPESQACVLCAMKYLTVEHLMRHMEKHRLDFERSCSVCQSGTLTGNMLLLHMEASHGPETSFPLPVAPSTAAATSNVSSIRTDISMSSLQTEYSEQNEPTGMKLPQQPQSTNQTFNKLASLSEETDCKSNTNSESEESFDYAITIASSKDEDEDSTLAHDNFLGIPSQFYPLVGCQVCGEKFALSEALDEHVKSQHKDTQCSYACKSCCLTFDTHEDYSKHVIRHEATCTNLKCSHCLKSFKSVKQLRLHYVAAHSCCHFCEYCRAGFSDAMSLELHEQLHTLDPDKLTFRCDICSKAFYTQSQCSAHKRTHKDEKAHACDVCASSFFKRGDLTKHVRTVHSPSRLFSCKYCGKKGTRMDNMRSHVRSHHKTMTRDQIVTMIEVIE